MSPCKHGQPYGEGQNKIDESESLLENGAAATANKVPSRVNLHKSNYLGKIRVMDLEYSVE